MNQQFTNKTPRQAIADIIEAWDCYPATPAGDLLGIVRAEDPGTKLGIVQQVGPFQRLIGRVILDQPKGIVVAHAFGASSLMGVQFIASEVASTFGATADVSQVGAKPVLLTEGDDGAEKDAEPNPFEPFDYDSDEATFGPPAFGD